MDFLPNLNKLFCIKLELGIKIFSLVLIVLSVLPYWPPALILVFVPGFRDTCYMCTVYLPLLVNALTFGLASFALQCLQWNKARVLLIPAAFLAPIWSFVCLICIVPSFVSGMMSGMMGVIFSLYFLLDSILLAYYWVGLISLYRNKNMPSDSSLLVNELE